ncbi:MAG: dihydroorotate dehydrogenase (quinone), partial [Candidatus Ratteibacteria bacterium]
MEILYIYIIKKILFLFDPEKVHDSFIKFGRYIGEMQILRFFFGLLFCNDDNDIIRQEIKNITFLSPIGLAAGFDKNADLINIIPCLGFGHGEFGSVTRHAYEGNPYPRLKRFPEIKSIWVNYGLKNIGVDKIIKRFEKVKSKRFIYGVSI